MNGLLFSSLLWIASPQGTLPSILTPDLPTLQAVWKQGYTYAQYNKNLYRPLKLARHGIGKIDGHWVSWVTFLHPRLLAYEAGFAANKQRLPSEQQSTSLCSLNTVIQQQTRQLRFHVELGLYPKGVFANTYVYRLADPTELQGVRVQMQIGDRIYEPLHQPDALVPDVHKGRYYYITGPATPDSGTASVRASYTWYESQFDVVFALSNPDGTPRITSSDKEIKVVVNGAFGQQSAKFDLDEWQEAYEK